jgi:hypothetical protein
VTDAGDEELERCRRRVGTTIGGKWRIDDVIGIGGMAAVYAATHRIGLRAAIKILHPQIAVSKELRKRFEQEAHAVSQLGHPATVQVTDIDVTEDGAPFMVMELLEGESLGQRAFRLNGVPEEELLRYMTTVLDVLGAAHTRGIVHRDIKPDNLFITAAGTMKVLDFGIAHMKQGGAGSLRTRTGALLGTTSYMAPEQIHGRGIDGRADLYAVGALMFRILAKRRIHEAESDVEMLMHMGTTPAPSLRVIAPQVAARISVIVDRALAFDRDRRYPDAATMQADIEAVLSGSEPPFAAAGALASDSPTRVEVPGAVPAPVSTPLAAAVAAPLGPTRAVGPVSGREPTATLSGPVPSYAEAQRAAPVAQATVAATSHAQPKTASSRVPAAVGIGAVVIFLAGVGLAIFMVPDCGDERDKKTARNDDDDDEEAPPAASPSATQTSSQASPSAERVGVKTRKPQSKEEAKRLEKAAKEREKAEEKRRERAKEDAKRREKD